MHCATSLSGRSLVLYMLPKACNTICFWLKIYIALLYSSHNNWRRRRLRFEQPTAPPRPPPPETNTPIRTLSDVPLTLWLQSCKAAIHAHTCNSARHAQLLVSRRTSHIVKNAYIPWDITWDTHTCFFNRRSRQSSCEKYITARPDLNTYCEQGYMTSRLSHCSAPNPGRQV